MPNCIKYRKTQSKLGCYLSRMSANDTSIYPGISNDKIDNLPDLPLNWVNYPFNNLNGDHLLKMMMHTNSSLQANIDKFVAKVTSLETQNIIMETKVQKSNIIDKQENEIDLLKKIVLSQQKFCEETPRKNLIISGVSTGNIILSDKELTNPEEKVDAILSSIGINLNNVLFKIQPFTTGVGKSTHSVKLIVDVEEKPKNSQRSETSA